VLRRGRTLCRRLDPVPLVDQHSTLVLHAIGVRSPGKMLIRMLIRMMLSASRKRKFIPRCRFTPIAEHISI
jgi:hypothetical protein